MKAIPAPAALSPLNFRIPRPPPFTGSLRATRQNRPAHWRGSFATIITRSWLEGACNERAAFGYNRDGKKGQRQIIIGLLCNARVQPLSIGVFAGHTQDPATMANQISKVVDRCGRSDSRIGGAVTLGRYSDSQTGRAAKAQ